MRKQVYVIVVFGLLNFALGYMFQLSRNVVCFLELGVLLSSGILFWISLSKPIRKATSGILNRSWSNQKKVLAIGGTGVMAVGLNLVFAQLVIFVFMMSIMNIHTPASDSLIASLTNNLAGNLLCFLALAGMRVHEVTRSKNIEPVKEIKDSVMISNGKSIAKIAYHDITKVESYQNSITVFASGRKYVKYQSLKSFLAENPDSGLARVHRSHAVNSSLISRIETNHNGDGYVHLTSGEQVRLSRTFKNNLL